MAISKSLSTLITFLKRSILVRQSVQPILLHRRKSPPIPRIRSSHRKPNAMQMPVSYTTSRKWSSDSEVWSRRWERTRRGLHRFFPRSGVPNWSYQDYLQHLSDVAGVDAENARLAMEQAIYRLRASNNYVPVVTPLHGRKPMDRYGTVLAMETVWRPDFRCDEVRWPAFEEMKYEGDGRMEGEGFGRRLPLPRPALLGNRNFRSIPRAPPLPFDDFEIPPTDADDIYLVYDQPIEEEAELLVGNSLLEAIERDAS